MIVSSGSLELNPKSDKCRIQSCIVCKQNECTFLLAITISVMKMSKRSSTMIEPCGTIIEWGCIVDTLFHTEQTAYDYNIKLKAVISVR